MTDTSAPVTSTTTRISIPDGQYIADFIAAESPLLSMAVGAIYNHFGGPLSLIIPASIVTDSAKKVLSLLSDAVRNQQFAFSVPTGVIADIFTQIESVAPNTLSKLEAALLPAESALFKSIGILPSS